MIKEMKVELSNHHIHLSEEDMKILYGADYEFSVVKKLGGINFVTDVTAAVVGPKGEIAGFKVLGPNRKLTQVELLKADTYKLGLKDVPVCESASEDTATVVTLRGTVGEITRPCAILAQRHIHIGNEIVDEYGVTDKALVKIRTSGIRSVEFNNVLVRVGKGNKCVIHLDTEEGNAAGLAAGDIVEVITEG